MQPRARTIPGTTLIATVYQEGPGIRRWLEALAAQTATPEECIVVDGESTDDTVLQITSFPWPADFPKPQVIVARCNIAAGRNIAIRHTAQPVIISSDAGSLPEPVWFEKIVAPFLRDPEIDVVAGESTFVLPRVTVEFLLRVCRVAVRIEVGARIPYQNAKPRLMNGVCKSTE